MNLICQSCQSYDTSSYLLFQQDAEPISDITLRPSCIDGEYILPSIHCGRPVYVFCDRYSFRNDDISEQFLAKRERYFVREGGI